MPVVAALLFEFMAASKQVPADEATRHVRISHAARHLYQLRAVLGAHDQSARPGARAARRMLRAFPHWAVRLPADAGTWTAVRPAGSIPPGPEAPMLWLRAGTASELIREWPLAGQATALLSGALALFPGALDEAKISGWGAARATWTLRLTALFAVAGLAALIAAAWRWHRRGVMLEERGTAYVIEEQAITWRHEEKESVLADVGGGFAAVLRVPGPAELGSNWRWEADGQTAPQWDARVDELVSSFWAVHYNDSQITDNAIFVWAPWPVAMAFGARATTRARCC